MVTDRHGSFLPDLPVSDLLTRYAAFAGQVARTAVQPYTKIYVDEELTRVATHVTELRRILEQGGAVGKRLDFLMQELNAKRTRSAPKQRISRSPRSRWS